MGNNQSNSARPHSSSSATAGQPAHTPSQSRRERGEPKIRDNLESKRSAAPPEPSLAQARGTSVSHRNRAPSGSHVQGHHSAAFGESQQVIVASPPRKDKEREFTAAQPQSIERATEKLILRDEPSKPVAVPISSSQSEQIGTATSLRSPYDIVHGSLDPMDGTSHYKNPPRMPLPIQEEIHTPGSPIIAPQTDDDIATVHIDDLDVELPRRASALSQGTGEEESADEEELPIDKTKASVPFDFEWSEGGTKVYVTGSIFQWSRKAKLYPVEGKPGHFHATLYVRPGTHHVRFIVDSDMQTSRNLPTTVDFGNNLVNYIEVSTDDVPKEEPTPETTQVEAMGTPVPDLKEKAESPAAVTEEAEPSKPAKKLRPVDPTDKYTNKIPQYLVDLDKAEDSTAYQYAAAAIEKLPSAPSLPGFLSKPILNAATPMKDDNSVLNMPNHTVLNHLATSSIKNNVLAVSATTRYKFKYVTTVMYKPTSFE